MDDSVAGLLDTTLAPARLLVREVRHWLPLVTVLAMVSAGPEILVKSILPDAGALLGGFTTLDLDLLVSGLGAVMILLGVKFLVELVTFMFAFVILADLTAGRTPDLRAGLRRLASWRLQGVWLLAGVLEQTAISMWWLGGTFLLLPFGLVTTAAYEEDSGFKAFPRSVDMGLKQAGPGGMDRPGMRLAVAVTAGFFVGFVVSSLLSVASCVATAATSGAALWGALSSGQAPDGSLTMPGYGPVDIVMDLVFSPVAMLPTIYMMTVQQMTYWDVRRAEQHAAESTPAGGP
jgi:hypothetical protein